MMLNINKNVTLEMEIYIDMVAIWEVKNMLENLVGKKVGIALKNYNGNPMVAKYYKGTVTECNDLFITIDNNFMIALSCIETIEIRG